MPIFIRAYRIVDVQMFGRNDLLSIAEEIKHPAHDTAGNRNRSYSILRMFLLLSLSLTHFRALNVAVAPKAY